MPSKNPDLHGNVPDTSRVVLIMIDVLNDLEFDVGPQLLEQGLPMAEHLSALKARAKAAGVPVIYVNDNFGRWRSDAQEVVRHCLRDGVRGEPLVRKLVPADDDYFVLKAKHSGFYHTTLDLLLEYLRAKTLVLTGLTADSCVLFTASDAFMRDLRIIVPQDCVASADPDKARRAIEQMAEVLHAEIVREAEIDWESLKRA